MIVTGKSGQYDADYRQRRQSTGQGGWLANVVRRDEVDTAAVTSSGGRSKSASRRRGVRWQTSASFRRRSHRSPRVSSLNQTCEERLASTLNYDRKRRRPAAR